MTRAELAETLRQLAARGERGALCTVVGVRGSAPRGVGARMLVHEDGRTQGSISGGCLEAEAFARAQEVMRGGQPQRFEYDLTRDVQAGEGMVCGGKVEVFVEAVGAASGPSPG